MNPLAPHVKELSTFYSTIVPLRFIWFAQGAIVKRREPLTCIVYIQWKSGIAFNSQELNMTFKLI